MTNHWVDLQNCKTILVEGSNVAENHPMAFKWIRKAQEKGAKIIHVDPRYTRTSAAADVYARIRPGTDAALQNTMINYIIVNKLYDEDYVLAHTNALLLGDEAFDFKDGVFSGYNAERHTYDTTTWGYQLDAKGKPRVASSLDHPHCVFTRLKTFVSRYTLEMGERITGIPAEQIQLIADMMVKNRPGAILYALGMTQHTTGVQGIRSFTILQLLLGNIGKPGGGVNALRGEPNVQGACDMAVLYNYMPGYINSATNAEPTIYHYVRKNGIADSRFLVNTLKAFFGEAATSENDYCYAWLPKRDAAKDYGTLPMFEDALAGKLKVLWVVGQNPAVTLPNLRLMFDAMAKLEFLPVPLAHFGYQPAAAMLRRWNGAYVTGAVTLFIYLMSRNVLYALITAVIFGSLAWIFRARDQKAEPVMLAIAAVTLSTMHQSSLGSLYLLMPNMLAAQWWSPVMPISFFLSSIAAGTALVVLTDMWIAKGWHRPLEITRLASVGQITFWSLLVYLVFRLGDMAIRNQFAGAFSGGLGLAFAAEIFLFGAVPLVLLARRSLRQRADVLGIASLLAVVGVAFNRMNVVLFAMTFRGRMPWDAPETYFPSTVEWGISIGLIAATIFLFGLGARLIPVLAKPQPVEGH